MPVVAQVQYGTLASTGSATTANPSQFDPDNSLLVFNYRINGGNNSNRPGRSMFRGEITNDTTLTFQNHDGGSSSATISWFLIEFSSGVLIDRGVKSGLTTTTDTVDLTNVTDHTLAIPFCSTTKDGGTHSDDDWVTIHLNGGTPNDKIEFNVYTASAGHTISWQVVQFDSDDVNIFQSFGFSLDGTSGNVSVSGITDHTNAVPFLSTKTNGGSGEPDENTFIGNLTSETNYAWSQITDPPQAQSGALYVLEFKDGATVRTGSVSMADATDIEDETLSPAVDLSLAVPFGPVYSTFANSRGKSSYSADDMYGCALASLVFTSDTNLRVDRDDSTGTFDTNWTIVEWNDTAGGGDVVIPFNVGSVSVSGPQFSVGEGLSFSTGAISVQGQSFDIVPTVVIDFNVASVAINGNAFDVSESIAFGVASVPLAGVNFDVSQGISFNVASLSLAGLSYDISEGVSFNVASVPVTGPAFGIDVGVSFGVGSVSVSGPSFSVSEAQDVSINFNAASVSPLGQAYQVAEGISFGVANIAPAWTAFEIFETVSFSAGQVNISGPEFDIGEGISYQPGLISIVGQNFTVEESLDVTIEFNSATITIVGSSFSITEGEDVSLPFAKANVTPVGQSFNISEDTVVSFGVGSVNVSGPAYNIDEQTIIPFGIGVITPSGQDFTVVADGAIQFGVGNVPVSTQSFNIDESTELDFGVGAVSVLGNNFATSEGISFGIANLLSANSFSVFEGGAVKIDGQSTYVLDRDGQTVMLYFASGQYYVLESYN